MLFKKTSVFVIIFSLILSFSLYSEKKEHNDEAFFKAFFKDHGIIWTSPLRFDTKDWIITLSLAGITAYLISNDESIYSRAKAYQAKNGWVTDLSPTMTLFGDGSLNLGLSGLFYISGALFNDSRAKNTGKLLLMGLLHSGIVVQLLKHLSSRQRPEAGNGIDHWEGPAGFFKRYNS